MTSSPSPPIQRRRPRRPGTGRSKLRSGLSAWPRWAPLAATVVLSGYATAALVGLCGGAYVFASPTNPDNVFADHWLVRQPRRIVEWVTLALGALGAGTMLIQRGRVGFGRLIVVAAGILVGSVTVVVLPGQLDLDAVPGLNLLNWKRLDWPTVHLVLLLYTGIAVLASTVAYGRWSRTWSASPPASRCSSPTATCPPAGCRHPGPVAGALGATRARGSGRVPLPDTSHLHPLQPGLRPSAPVIHTPRSPRAAVHRPPPSRAATVTSTACSSRHTRAPVRHRSTPSESLSVFERIEQTSAATPLTRPQTHA